MDKPLFFMPLIVAALNTPNPREELKKAVKQIADNCKKLPFTQGCMQFVQFMEEATAIWDMRQKMPNGFVVSVAADLDLELSLGLFDGSEWEAQAARRLIGSQKFFQDFSLNSLADRPDSLEEHTLKFVVKRDEIPIGTWRLGKSVQSIILPRIIPGTYTFGLSTGWRLLSMELSEKNLVWSRAFPDQDLQVAADTGDTGLTPSRQVSLWDGKLVVQVFPGIESGRIVIKVKDLC